MIHLLEPNIWNYGFGIVVVVGRGVISAWYLEKKDDERKTIWDEVTDSLCTNYNKR